MTKIIIKNKDFPFLAYASIILTCSVFWGLYLLIVTKQIYQEECRYRNKQIKYISENFYKSSGPFIKKIINKKNKHLALKKINSQVEAQELNQIDSFLISKIDNEFYLFDLSEIINLSKIYFEQDFFYSIKLDNKRKLQNVENIHFEHKFEYTIGKNKKMNISLSLRPESKLVQNMTSRYNERIKQNYMFALMAYMLFISIIIYLYNQIHKNHQVKVREELLRSGKRRLLQLKNQYNSISKKSREDWREVEEISIQSTMKDILIILRYYAEEARLSYKIKLECSDDNIQINIERVILEQILFSFIANAVFLMNFGAFQKNIDIKISKNSFKIQYDAFSTNEKQLQRLSNEFASSNNDEAILDCEEIFELLKRFKISYSITPKPRKNILEINFLGNIISSKIIKFANGK